jgi:hypothetical protein
VPLSRAKGPHRRGRRSVCAAAYEFGQITDQLATDDGPDAGDRAQKILFGPPDGACLDSAVQVVINIVELALKLTDVLDDAPADSRHGVLETVAFGAHHPEDLTPPRQQGVQGLGAVVGQYAGIRPCAPREFARSGASEREEMGTMWACRRIGSRDT